MGAIRGAVRRALWLSAVALPVAAESFGDFDPMRHAPVQTQTPSLAHFDGVSVSLTLLAIDPATGAPVELESSAWPRPQSGLDQQDSAIQEAPSVRAPHDVHLEPGARVRWVLEFTNVSQQILPAGTLVLTQPLPEYVHLEPGSARHDQAQVLAVSQDGRVARVERLDGLPLRELRWVWRDDVLPGAGGSASFLVRIE